MEKNLTTGSVSKTIVYFMTDYINGETVWG